MRTVRCSGRPGGGLPKGVSAQRGCLHRGGVCTGVKTLPFRNLVCDSNKVDLNSRYDKNFLSLTGLYLLREEGDSDGTETAENPSSEENRLGHRDGGILRGQRDRDHQECPASTHGGIN